MNNVIKRNLSIRKGFIIGVLVLIIINILFISVYYRLFLFQQIDREYQKLNTELEDKIDEVLEK
ncbi:MAG TPA: hypothetical protein DCE23_08520, partial [Firmicutes bacterium]|nr:hypothetical protein [Bacillota bacterium]